MLILLSIIFTFILLYLGLATIYLLILAALYFILSEQRYDEKTKFNQFAVIVPAHNEEMLVGNICQSLLDIDYPEDKYSIFVVADNCIDNTVNICHQYPVKILERHDLKNIGKGHALSWVLNRIDLTQFDAVFIVDADNFVDSYVLKELNRHINNNEQAIQCCNSVGNRNDSWFTELLYVSRTIGNLLYHEVKYRLGFSSYLMGNGICFKAELLRKKGWTAFSAGEDWEYYAQLVESGILISFASRAKVFHQESKTLNQATSQRLRWSSGRFRVARTLGWRLLMKGIRAWDWRLIDASFPLMFPNYSLLVNLTLLGFFISLFFLSSTPVLYFSFLFLLICQSILFLTGSIICRSPLKTLRAAFFAPFFLLWKGSIDLLCFIGLYRSKKWVRTERHKSKF